jgi:predicted nucleic acid-binding protein
VRYLESSALVAALLEHDTTAIEALPAGARLVTSALTFAETARAIVRARAAGRLTPDQERAAIRGLRTFKRRSYVLDVDRAVLGRAGRRFPVEPIRTFDAIHLATAELLDEAPALVTIVTRDARVRENALVLGYAVE